MICETCATWGREPSDALEDHHPRCPEKGNEKSLDELIGMGGKFYKMGSEAWCDTAVASWRFVLSRGRYVRIN